MSQKFNDMCRLYCNIIVFTPFRNTSEVYGKAAYGEGNGTIWSGNLDCDGSEERIKQCVNYYLYESDILCDHKRDVSINCLPQNGEYISFYVLLKNNR